MKSFSEWAEQSCSVELVMVSEPATAWIGRQMSVPATRTLLGTGSFRLSIVCNFFGRLELQSISTRVSLVILTANQLSAHSKHTINISFRSYWLFKLGIGERLVTFLSAFCGLFLSLTVIIRSHVVIFLWQLRAKINVEKRNKHVLIIV